MDEFRFCSTCGWCDPPMHKKYLIFGENEPNYNNAVCTHPNTDPKMILDKVSGKMKLDTLFPLRNCRWLRAEPGMYCGTEGSWWEFKNE